MRLGLFVVVLLALVALVAGAPALRAGPHPECERFEREAAHPRSLAPRLERLCARLVEAYASPGGMSEEEAEAARLLGKFLAVLGELDLRKGAVSIGSMPARAQAATTETARYLIAHRIGLLAVADRLAPSPKTAGLR